jgi:putative peptidoglycan binding protein
MTNPYIAQQRTQFVKDLVDPTTHDQVCAMMITEDAAHPVPCLESLLNRILYCNSRGWKQTILSMLHSGFYGPYNRGMYPRTIRQLQANPALQAKMDAAIATVMAGSDLIHGFTDQGLPTDPNGQRQPQMRLGGNIFNDWGGGPGGHDGAEAWRQVFEAAAAKVAPPAPGPVAGMHTTDNLQLALNHFGYAPTLNVDGQYGAATKAAVKWFQARQSLTVDGVPGPMTWAWIDAAINGDQIG